ncbi:MAG: DUF6441 family protein [Sphaerospermopsis kisseleviana]
MSIESKAARDFFAAEIKDLQTATRAVIKASARQFKQEIQKQVRTNFKRGTFSNGSFFKAFKIYDLNADVVRGPASYVRAGVPFLHIFTTFNTITAKGDNLAILLPEGEKIGFRRISKGNTWTRVFSQYGKYMRIFNTKGGGKLIAYDYGGKLTPVYLLIKRVRLRKRLDFWETAQTIANQIPNEINKLL